MGMLLQSAAQFKTANSGHINVRCDEVEVPALASFSPFSPSQADCTSHPARVSKNTIIITTGGSSSMTRVNVIRPGAANEGKKTAFTRRYQGMEPVIYPHPSLEACLKSTYGLVVYEEHILQICEAFAGLPPGRADVLRRALNKYKQKVIYEIHREFIASAKARGHAPEKITEVLELVTGFVGYAFCKAHSTAYGMEAYQSAWLKRYYPPEFMAAVITNGKGFMIHWCTCWNVTASASNCSRRT